jgi:hypothetical protein
VAVTAGSERDAVVADHELGDIRGIMEQTHLAPAPG